MKKSGSKGSRGLKSLNHSNTQSFKSFKCLAILLLLLIFVLPAEAQVAQKKSVPLEKKVSDLEAEVTKLKREIEIYNLDGLPDALVLCDKKIPLFRDDIRERFEREFFQFLENKGLLTIIIKRYFK